MEVEGTLKGHQAIDREEYYVPDHLGKKQILSFKKLNDVSISSAGLMKYEPPLAVLFYFKVFTVLSLHVMAW